MYGNVSELVTSETVAHCERCFEKYAMPILDARIAEVKEALSFIGGVFMNLACSEEGDW